MDKRIIVGSRGKIALALLGCVGFVALSILILVSWPDDEYRGLSGTQVGWLGIVTFGVFFLMGAAQIVRPNRLTLSDAGFRYDGLLFRPRVVEWRDVDEFYLRQVRSTAWVAYRLRPKTAAPNIGASWHFGPPSDPALGGMWPIRPPELAALLNGYLERSRGASSSPA